MCMYVNRKEQLEIAAEKTRQGERGGEKEGEGEKMTKLTLVSCTCAHIVHMYLHSVHAEQERTAVLVKR